MHVCLVVVAGRLFPELGLLGLALFGVRRWRSATTGAGRTAEQAELTVQLLALLAVTAARPSSSARSLGAPRNVPDMAGMDRPVTLTTTGPPGRLRAGQVEWPAAAVYVLRVSSLRSLQNAARRSCRPSLRFPRRAWLAAKLTGDGGRAGRRKLPPTGPDLVAVVRPPTMSHVLRAVSERSYPSQDWLP